MEDFDTRQTTRVVKDNWGHLDIEIENFNNGARVQGNDTKRFHRGMRRMRDELGLTVRFNKLNSDSIKVWIDKVPDSVTVA